MDVLNALLNYLSDTGFVHFHWTNLVMIGVGLLFILLAVKKGFEPLLLVPIGFGILMGNIPFDSSKLPLSVYDGPVSEHDLWYYEFDAAEGIDSEHDLIHTLHLANGPSELFTGTQRVLSHVSGHALAADGRAYVINTHNVLTPRTKPTTPGVYSAGQGRYVFVPNLPELSDERVAELRALAPDTLVAEGGTADTLIHHHDWWAGGRFPEVWSLEKQDVHGASVLWWLFAGVGLAGFYPPLIFLGIGALTDFGPMLSNPKTLLLGAAAQFGIFGALIGAVVLGFSMEEAASIGIIGGADGPTAIFTCATLAPDLLGAVALAAYSYMALVPIIQPPIIKLLTTKEERLIRMEQKKEVSRTVKIIFPVIGFILTAMIAPGGLPLLGMLFFGNLLRESMVTDRLAKTAQTTFIDIVTILLGVTVGAKTAAANFLTMETIFIFILGIAAFAIATATGVLAGKLMNKLSKDPVNPMIGAAGVSAVPMAARVVHKLGQEEDPQNFLLMHAMGPNVAGVIGSAVAAGVLLSSLAGN